MGHQQSADRRIHTPEQIAESLLSGQHELVNFPDLFRLLPAKAKYVIQNIIDRVQPLQIQVRSLECQLDHLKERAASSAYPNNPHMGLIHEIRESEIFEQEN